MKKNLFTIILFIPIIFTAFLSVYNFRYKNYSESNYIFILKDKDKKYKMSNSLSLVKDKLTQKYYIQLSLNKVQHGENLTKIINLDSSNYTITESDSNFYDGILNYDTLETPYVKISSIVKEIDIRKSYTIEEIHINYNNKKLNLISDPKNINSRYKKYKLPICESWGGTTSCNSEKAYGISFKDFKNEFNLKLSIEVDNKNKIVYIIKN